MFQLKIVKKIITKSHFIIAFVRQNYKFHEVSIFEKKNNVISRVFKFLKFNV